MVHTDKDQGQIGYQEETTVRSSTSSPSPRSQPGQIPNAAERQGLEGGGTNRAPKTSPQIKKKLKVKCKEFILAAETNYK